jgi:tetratricopeptide (TPR) repeat protein
MKRGLNLAVLLALLADATIAQSVRELGGKIFHHDENGAEVADQRVGVSLDEVGLSRITNDSGVFLLPLLRGLQIGDRVTLSIDKPGWQIFDPLGGRMKIRSSGKEFVQVMLLPKGSPEFLAHDRLGRFFGDLSERAKQDEAGEAPEMRAAAGLPRPGTRKNQRGSSLLLFPPALQPAGGIAFAADKRERPIRDPFDIETASPAPDFDRYIREWAAKYGFSVAEVETEIDRWIAEVETHRDDAHRLGLAAFARSLFAEAARHFRDSATAGLGGRPRDELVDDLRLEGDSFHYAGDSRKALASYQEAHSHTSRGETPALWAATLQDIALAQGHLAGENPPAAGMEHLAVAVEAYRQTSLVFTQERLPRPWAMTQNNLGVALAEQASRSDGKLSNDLFAAAIEAYRQALLVYSRDRLPQEWAKTQNNLAITLRARADCTEGESGAQLLAEAVDSYRQALQVRTREQLPEDWAATQNNLGVALRDQASHTGGERGAQLLTAAVEAYQQALQVRTRERFPQQWARTQDNLGSALQDQALQTGGEAGAQLLAQAVQAFRQALQVRTREQLPKDWATTRNNLGAALRDQA